MIPIWSEVETITLAASEAEKCQTKPACGEVETALVTVGGKAKQILESVRREGGVAGRVDKKK